MKNLVTILFLIVCFSINAHSQIFYQDIDPDVVIDEWSVYVVHIDSVFTSTLNYGDPGNLSVWQEFSTRIVVNAFSGCEVLMDGTLPAALETDQVIDNTGIWVQPDYAVLFDGSTGHWQGVEDKYLGVKVFNGEEWLYGWIRLDVNNAGNSVTIKDYACNRTAGEGILAGQKETSGINSNDKVFKLSVFPNPFSEFTTISFSLAEPSNVKITIFDAKGTELEVLTDDLKPSGDYKETFYCNNYQSGLYYYSIQIGDKIESGRVVLVK